MIYKERVKRFQGNVEDMFNSSISRVDISETLSSYQDLKFIKLQAYHLAKEIPFDLENFEERLKLRNIDGKYNLLGLLLSDDNHMCCRVNLCAGKDISFRVLHFEEFGNTCFLFTIYMILEYERIINIPQCSDDGTWPRVDTPYFDSKVFIEAVINAFENNDWSLGVSPQINVYKTRLEIISSGGLSKDQTEESFFKGVCRSFNAPITELFDQSRIRGNTRGISNILNTYGKQAFTFGDDYIKVTIPFNIIGEKQKVVDNIEKKFGKLGAKIIEELKDNPNLKIEDIAKRLKVSESSISKYFRKLKDHGIIERVGSDKKGYWIVKKI